MVPGGQEKVETDSEWYDYLADCLEEPEGSTPVPNGVEVPEGVDEEVRRSFFLEHRYPYRERLGLKEYYGAKRKLQVELVKLQNWVKTRGERLVVVFEGRDAAGKGSSIKRFMEYLNPRGARVVALDKPTDDERRQWYFQRYVRHLPTAGEMVFFDRSWYNRAGVEWVMGFCTEGEYRDFMEQAPQFERMLVTSGIRLVKIYFSVGQEEQRRRFEERKRNPLKQWKLSPLDLKAQQMWEGYTEAKEAIFRLTHHAWAPWTVIKADDKLRARLAAMRLVLQAMPYDGKDPSVATPPDPLIVATPDELYPEELGQGPASG